MVILIAADVSIKSVTGGAERVLYEESTRLAKKGHDVYILTRRLPCHSCNYEVIEGVKEYRYEVDQRNSLAFLYTTIVNSRRMFLSLIKEKSFDVINLHQPFTAFGINLIKESQNIRKVYTCHSLSFEEYETRHAKPDSYIRFVNYTINSKIRRYIERKSLFKSCKIIVLSDFTTQKLIDNYGIDPGKVVVIPGAVDLLKFHPADNQTKIKIREELLISSLKFILLTVRNLVPRMGLDNLILAMEKVSREAEDIFLIIGGEGPLKDKLENLIVKKKMEKFVKLAGFIPENKLPLYYQIADIFILPTQCLEGFGMVTLEALACGIPVLGTNTGGTVEILSKFNENLLIKGNDPETIANSILSHYRSFKDRPDNFALLSKECRKYVEKHFTWDIHIDRLEGVLNYH